MLALVLPLAAAAKPNILFIYLDDFGWKDAGFMGSDFYETPHLDALAAERMARENPMKPAGKVKGGKSPTGKKPTVHP